MAVQIQFRRDTTANWNSVNPLLAQGEVGFDITTNQIKVGDGTNYWTGLTYTMGDDGTSGSSGTDGASGSSGSSGIDGTSGSSGSSGKDGGGANIAVAASGTTSYGDRFPYLLLYTGSTATLAGGNFNGGWMTDQMGLYQIAAVDSFTNTYTRQLYFGNAIYLNYPIGICSAVIGADCGLASNIYCVVIGGQNNEATGYNCVAAGGAYVHAHGENSIGLGGQNNTANAKNSAALGWESSAEGYGQLVVGQFNISTGTTDAADLGSPKFIVGTGTGSTYRFNALEVSHNFTEIKNKVALTDVVTGAKYGVVMSGGTLTTYAL